MNRAVGHDDRDPEDRHFPSLWNWRCGAPHREHPVDSATTPLVARNDYPPGAVEGDFRPLGQSLGWSPIEDYH
jgi:hypothetical protein